MGRVHPNSELDYFGLKCHQKEQLSPGQLAQVAGACLAGHSQFLPSPASAFGEWTSRWMLSESLSPLPSLFFENNFFLEN